MVLEDKVICRDEEIGALKISLRDALETIEMRDLSIEHLSEKLEDSEN